MRERIEKLETALATPFIPGELANWLSAVDRSLGAIEAELNHRIGVVHREQLAQIRQQDLDLASNVTELKTVDRSLLQVFSLRARAALLAAEAADLEPDEAAFRPQAAELSERGLRFVMEMRKQETAIRTWFQEAFDRECGTGD